MVLTLPCVLLLLLPPTLQAEADCPSHCPCSWKSSKLHMDCPEVTYLPDLPKIGTPQIKVLTISKPSRVGQISSRQLYDNYLDNLQRIVVVDVQLRTIEEHAFYHMPYLTHVNVR